jgi:hypothetical protein
MIRGEKSLDGWDYKQTIKFIMFKKRIGLAIIVSGYLCEQRWFEILETIEGASMKGPMEIQ